MTEKLVIKIKKDGTIESETLGIKGKKCEDYMQLIEELTESKTVNIEHTHEYYEDNENENVLQETKKEKNNK